jgi:hypothetical protein
MGQFDLTDLAVFKVMFSAIVTAMLGLFWLSRLGVLDLSRVYLPETFLLPQLLGGAVFGVGFAIAGLCPGTSCVAAATGRGDGVAVMAGMLGGVALAGAALPVAQRLYLSTPRGGLTLPRLLGMPEGVVAMIVVAVALAAFGFAARVERHGQMRARAVPSVSTPPTGFSVFTPSTPSSVSSVVQSSMVQSSSTTIGAQRTTNAPGL